MSDEKVLNEAFGRSMIARGRIEKIAALRGAFAVKIAREKKDPLYTKMIRFKKAYKLTKKQLITKYGMKGLMAARQAAANFGNEKK